MDWKEYENEIYDFYRKEYPRAKIERDVKKLGRYSKTERQIDTFIEDSIAGLNIKIIVDGKYYKKRIDVKDVEAFLGMIADVGANKGVMISPLGYSQAAINRAYHDPSDLELEVFSFAEFKKFQGGGGVAYSGNHGVILSAPFGWILDGTRREGFVASLYQRGLDFDTAIKRWEWMYVNFSIKGERFSTLEELLKYQEAYTKNDFPDSEITFSKGPYNRDRETLIRTIRKTSYPVTEYTGFVEFENFTFFSVLFSPIESERKNLSKLEYVLASVIPLDVMHGKVALNENRTAKDEESR